MDDGVAVGVEAEPLLPDRRGGEYEGPERGVEGPAELLGPVVGLLLGAGVTEPGEGREKRGRPRRFVSL